MAKTIARGVVFKMQTAAGPPIVYTAVGNLTSIGVPGPTRSEIDITDFDSTAKEFLGGLPDSGEMSFSGFFNYANAGQLAVLTAALAATAAIVSFKIEIPAQAVQFTFPGYVQSFVPSAGGPEEAVTFDGSVRVTGAVVVAALP